MKSGDFPFSNSRDSQSSSKAKMLAIVGDPSEVYKLSSVEELKGEMGIDTKFIVLNNDHSKGRYGLIELSRRRGVDPGLIKDYGLFPENIEEEALNWFRAFPDTKLRDNKTIKEILKHEGISIWWLVDELIFNDQFVFNTSVAEILRYTMLFERIIDEEDPSIIWCTQRNRLVYHIVNSICQSRGITLLTPPHLFNVREHLSQKTRPIIHVCGQWAIALVRKFWWTLLGGNPAPNPLPHGKRILVFSGDNWQNVSNLKTGTMQKGDMYFDSVIEILKENDCEVIFVDIPTDWEARWFMGTMGTKRREDRIVYRPFESYLTIGGIFTSFKVARKLHNDFESLSNLRAFRESMIWHDISLRDLLNKNISFAFSLGHLTRIIAICEMVKCMVEKEKPDGIIMAGEFPSARPMIAMARQRAIPTLLFQHGTYSSYHSYYNHSEEDISHYGDWSAPYCPIPDKIAVYSDKDKSNLVSRGKFYERDVVVIGQPRYDIVAKAPQIFSREVTFRKLNLNPDKKLIVWCTDTNAMPIQENEMNIAAIYNAMKLLREVQLVIKLHPAEDQKATLYKKNTSYNPLILDKNAVTIQLLHAADLVIANLGSTTLIEAMMLDKPGMIVNLTGRKPSLSYIDEGAIIGVSREEDIVPAIRNVLYNEQIRGTLAEARRDFLRKNNYIQDGQASKRAVDLILQMIEEAEQRGGRKHSIQLSKNSK